MNRSILLNGCAIVVVLAMPAFGGDWPQFRGPFFNGSSDEQGLPSRWSKTENVVWVAPLPGPGAATPCVWGDRVFVSSYDKKGNTVLAICLDRLSGAIRWQRVVAKAGEVRTSGGTENFMAAPSPATDGKRVFFLFGTGDLVSFSMDGVPQWQRNLQDEYGEFKIIFGYAASPLLHEGRLFVPVIHRSDDSYLLAVDPQTGETLWRHHRPSDARAESKEAYTTPMPLATKGEWSVLVLGGDCLSAHDPHSGQERWRWSGLNPRDRGNFRIVTSAVIGAGQVFVTSPQGSPMYALDCSGANPIKRWMFEKPTSDTPTPVFHDDKLFVLAGKKKVMTCLKPMDGTVHWTQRLDVNTYLRASPTAGDGKLYCISADGEALVLSAGKQPQLLWRTEMGEYPCRSSIVIAHGQLFIRTGENLYCIGGE